MSFLSMDKQYGATNFITISKDWCIDESKCRSLVPPQTGVNGTGMIASFRLVIIVIIFHELRCIFGWFRIHCRAGVSTRTIIFCALRIELPTHPVACICIVRCIEITVGIGAADIVHGRSHRSLDARVIGRCIDSKASPTANAEYADTLRIHIGTCGKVIHCCRKVLRIDIG